MCTYQRGGQDHSINCSPHAVGSKDLAQSQYASLQINSVQLPLLFFVIGTTFIVLGWSGAKFLLKMERPKLRRATAVLGGGEAGATRAPPSLSFSKPSTHGSNFVAVQITHIRRIKIRAVMRAQARGAFGSPAVDKGGGMEITDLFPRSRPECDHRSVAGRSGMLIEWFAYPKREFARAVVFVGSPTR
jgi:hypothetical protein